MLADMFGALVRAHAGVSRQFLHDRSVFTHGVGQSGHRTQLGHQINHLRRIAVDRPPFPATHLKRENSTMTGYTWALDSELTNNGWSMSVIVQL